jgi:flagellar biosynthesis protein FliR
VDRLFLGFPNAALDSIDAAHLLSWATGAFVAFTLVVTRISGMVVIGPIFGHPNIPRQVRVFLVLAMSLVVTPVLLSSDQNQTFRRLDRDSDGKLVRDEVPESLKGQIEELLVRAGKSREDALVSGEFRLSLPAPVSVVEYAGLALMEFGVGIALGLGVMIVVSGLQMAGSLIDGQIGVSLGDVFNPEFHSNATISGEMLHQLALVIFLIVGGHTLMVSALVDTFQALPVGYAWVASPTIELLSDFVHQSLALAIKISAPVIGIMAVVGLSMGFLGHTIPQINVLVIGFPVRTLLGIFILGLALPAIADALTCVVPGAIEQMARILTGG